MKDLNSTYTLPIDFEMAFTLASSEDWNSFSLYGNKLIYNGIEDQNVTFLKKSDKTLLDKSLSLVKFFEKECMQITIHCLGGDQYSSQVIKGKRESVSSLGEMRAIIKDLSFECRRNGRHIRHIEVSHTHLGRQYIEIENDKVKKVKTHGLSKRDLDCMRELKEFIECPIKVRAITQEHMVYEKMIA